MSRYEFQLKAEGFAWGLCVGVLATLALSILIVQAVNREHAAQLKKEAEWAAYEEIME